MNSKEIKLHFYSKVEILNREKSENHIAKKIPKNKLNAK